MNNERLLIFDDGGGCWGPLTDRRAVFCLRTGAVTTRARIERVVGSSAEAVAGPLRLAPVLATRWSEVAVNPALVGSERWLLVNGRWNALRHVDRVRDLSPGEVLLDDDGSVIAARVSADEAQRVLASGCREAPRGVGCVELHERGLLRRPWHLMDELEAALRDDIASTKIPLAVRPVLTGVWITGEHPVHIAADAKVGPGVVIDAGCGPVAIDAGATVGSFVTLQGPCYVGRGTTVNPQTSLRSGTVIGPRCKAGGEISASVMHGYSNKSHLGYLGNSYVGQWCNLGAATNISNLKNTYGEVRMKLEADMPAEGTGRMQQGPLLGDFVRTAIGTRFTTGAVVGTGAMLAATAFAPKYVPRFAFLTDEGQQYYDVEKFLATARAMCARRDLELDAEEEALLRTLHAEHEPGRGGKFRLVSG